MNREVQKSIINWVGGKSQLRGKIAEFIPENLTCYCEPFGGAGWVMFYKSRWAKCEVYNDISKDLVNLFTVTKYHPQALIDELESILPARSIFDYLKNYYHPITDIQRAAKFMYLLNYSYAGMQENFGYGRVRGKKSTANLMERIKQISARLDKVYIENLNYDDVISRYDSVDTLFYCDPPYYVDSVKAYDTVDHAALRDVLASIKGRFVLSYDDRPEIRELYHDFKINEVSRKSCISQNKSSEYHELIITNF